jgi:hypothetical protein
MRDVWVRVSFAPDRQLFTGTRRVVAHGTHASMTWDPRSHPLTPDSTVLFYPVQSRTAGTVRTPCLRAAHGLEDGHARRRHTRCVGGGPCVRCWRRSSGARNNERRRSGSLSVFDGVAIRLVRHTAASPIASPGVPAADIAERMDQ